MRYGIFSDIHSNLEALNAVIAAYQSERIDTYLCVGDVVGYAADPQACIEKVKAFTSITIAGNHDWASVDLLATDYFNPHAKAAVSWTRDTIDASDKGFLVSLGLIYRNEDLTLVHGTLEQPENFNYLFDIDDARSTFFLLETRVCFLGHTHVPVIITQEKDGSIHFLQGQRAELIGNKKYIINVGSVGQPRDGNPDAAYCVYDTEKKEIQLRRVAYDVMSARKKIYEAGLPRYLGDRLLAGR